MTWLEGRMFGTPNSVEAAHHTNIERNRSPSLGTKKGRGPKAPPHYLPGKSSQSERDDILSLRTLLALGHREFHFLAFS